MRNLREEERYRESWSLAVDFFSTPRTMVSVPRTPTAALPLRTASRAYSTWNRWPSGENTVIARSYRAIFLLLAPLLLPFLRFCSAICFSSLGQQGKFKRRRLDGLSCRFITTAFKPSQITTKKKMFSKNNFQIQMGCFWAKPLVGPQCWQLAFEEITKYFSRIWKLTWSNYLHMYIWI